MASPRSDPPTDDDGDVSDGASNGLKERLAQWWQAGNWPEFYTTVIAELQPKVVGYLVKKGLSTEDGEDCCQDILQALVDLPDDRRGQIDDPHAYIWRCVHNGLADLVKGREKEAAAAAAVRDDLRRRDNHSRPRHHEADGVAIRRFGPFSVHAAVIMAESLVEGLDADEHWVVDIMAEAIRRLSPALQNVAAHMLTFGPNCPSADAERDLNTNAVTYRSSRFRALARLQVLVPEVLRERGIVVAVVEPADLVIRERHEFPSLED
jgi:DNA-directed RNA polymerase specialized sigma24 family protein